MYIKIQLEKYLRYASDSNDESDKYMIKTFDLYAFVNEIKRNNTKNINGIINQLITKYAIENKMLHPEYNLMISHIQIKPKSQINDVLSIKLICFVCENFMHKLREISINPFKFQQILNEAIEIYIL